MFHFLTDFKNTVDPDRWCPTFNVKATQTTKEGCFSNEMVHSFEVVETFRKNSSWFVSFYQPLNVPFRKFVSVRGTILKETRKNPVVTNEGWA